MKIKQHLIESGLTILVAVGVCLFISSVFILTLKNYYAALVVLPAIAMIVASFVLEKRYVEVDRRGRLRKNMAGCGCMLFVVLVCVVMALPPFLVTKKREKRIEARNYLGAISRAQDAYFDEHKSYAAGFKDLEGLPEASFKRYAIFLDKETIQPEGVGPYELPPDFITYAGPEGFRAIAVGNIDGDSTLDILSIDEKKDLETLLDDVTE